MTMASNIRVKTDRRYRALYKQLTSLVVGDSHELFFVCACLAFKKGQRLPMGKSGDERFWSATITPDEWSCYYAIRLVNNEMAFESIQDDAQVVSEMEEYANAGMAILLDDLLCDYTNQASEEVVLDTARCTELPKVFLHYVAEQGL